MNSSDTNDRCFLTIGIPVFNEETRLHTMLDSLEKQDWSLFEVRFSDDGSTDRTADVIRDFAARHPGRVFYQRHEKEGVGFARNHIISEARGEYLWFCDGDDAIVTGSVPAMARCLAGKTCDILAFRGPRPVHEENLEHGIDDSTVESADPILLTRAQAVQYVKGGTWAKILRVSFLRERGIRFPSERISQDRIFSIEATCKAQTTLFWNVRPYWYVLRGDSATKLDDRFIRDMAIGIAHMERQAEEFPEFRHEIEFQILLALLYEIQRIDEGSEDFRTQHASTVWKGIREFVQSRTNPLLSGVFSLAARNRKLRLELKKRECEVQKFKTRLHRRNQQLASIRQSLSWRLTAPLRAIFHRASTRHT